MCNLKELRLNSRYPEEVILVVHKWSMPNLEVLELDVQGDLFLYLLPGLALQRLVLITAGSMHLNERECLLAKQTCTPRLTELYLQSSGPFPPSDMAALLARYAKQPCTEVKLSDYVTDKQRRCIAQMPASFQPGNLRECCCGACPECLARGGVPIVCDKAWTRDGVEKHLKPHVRRSTQDIEQALGQLSMASLKSGP